MDAQTIDTVKTVAVTPGDELTDAREKYNAALEAMLSDPTQDNIANFTAANNYLFEIEDRYRLAAKYNLMTRR